MKFITKSIIIMLLSLGFTACSNESDASNGEKTGKNNENVETANANDTSADTTAKEQTPADLRYPIRDEGNAFVTIKTDFGNMTMELYRDIAPAHADSFLARSTDGFYKGTIFHRIIKGFMAQGGDPTGTGTGNAGYYLNAEFNKLPHQEGTLSMARGGDPNSASCQFFLVFEKNQATTGLNGKYTVFGQMIKGFDVLNQIKEIKVKPNARGENSVPIEDFYFRDAWKSDAEGNKI